MKHNVALLLAFSLTAPLACSGGDGPGTGHDSSETSGGTKATGGRSGSGSGSAPSSGGTGGDAETSDGGAKATGGASSGGSGTSGGAGAGGAQGGGDGSGGAPPVKIPDAVACEPVQADHPTVITVDGDDVASENKNGLTFKGFGVLSANSTSAVLLDYKYRHPEKYAELLRVLFGGPRPIMNHIKFEMGNDSNTSTGPDPATKRSASEPANVGRAPGFQFAADAKKLNPDIKVSILRWHSPAWVGTNNDRLYTWFKETILAAYREYGYMVDYVNPGENEHAANLTWTKEYANRVRTDSEGFESAAERELYNRIQVVISDEVGTGSFGGQMISDAALRAAVGASGFHYNTDDDGSGNFTRLAEQFDHQIWNSEAQATFSNTSFRPNASSKSGIGGAGGPLEMGNTIIKGFDRSRRTLFIYQPAIGSFYEGGQYSHKELISARDPWSGWIHYDAGIQVLRHFSWFAKTGWENEDNSAGIWRAVPQASDTGATGTNPVDGRNGTPSYMTLASPDKADFSVVMVNDSSQTKYYRIRTANLKVPESAHLEVWETRAADDGPFNENYMRYQCDLARDDGAYTLEVKPWSAVTVTTLANREIEAFHQPLPVEGERQVLDTDESGHERDTKDNILYADDFDYSKLTVGRIGDGGVLSGTEAFIATRGGPKSTIARYSWDRNGAFEVFLPDGSENYVLRQQGNMGTAWNAGEPVTAIGDKSWLNYRASVDVTFETVGGDRNYAGIGARQQGGGNSHGYAGTAFTLRLWQDGGWYLNRMNQNVASGTIAGFDGTPGKWHKLALEVDENQITAFIDGVEVHSFTDDTHLAGRVDLLSGPLSVQFDNLLVERLEGKPAYYVEYLDNLEMYDLSPERKKKLEYSGNWAHEVGKSMYDYHRTLSTSSGAGATLKYTFTGTGLDILGGNNGTAALDVTIDGKLRDGPAAQTRASDQLYQTFSLRGLPRGEHTVELKVLSGTLVVDAVGVVE
jgi:hypothetical protein